MMSYFQYFTFSLLFKIPGKINRNGTILIAINVGFVIGHDGLMNVSEKCIQIVMSYTKGIIVVDTLYKRNTILKPDTRNWLF